MAQTDFGRVLSRTEVQFKRASDALTQTRLFSEQSNLNAAYEAASGCRKAACLGKIQAGRKA